MTSVEDVARELALPTDAVLDACRSLDILVSSPGSGLSSAEHRQLRDHLHAGDLLDPVRVGSTEPRPTTPAAGRPRRARPEPAPERGPRRPSPRTLSRLAVYTFLVVAVIASVATFNSAADPETDGETEDGSPMDDPGADEAAGPDAADSADAADAADAAVCLDLHEAGVRSGVVTRPCDEPHDAELFQVAEVGQAGNVAAVGPDDPFPGPDAIAAEAEAACGTSFDAPADGPEIGVAYVVPTPGSWDGGDRTILCLVEGTAGPLVGSVTG